MSLSALGRVRERGHIGIRLGLDRMRSLLRELGDPQASLRGVLIGGTNGKGSTQAMVAEVLRAAGRTTLQSPSPHLSSYTERIVVDGAAIGPDDLEAVLAEVLRASERGEATHGPATQFELLTAAAFLWGARSSVDVAVIEVGLGGRLDATNVWDGGVAAITGVGLDHREYLGDTLEAVAAEKAAIIKPGDRAVSGAVGTALAVIAARCASLDVPLTTTAPLPVERLDRDGLLVAHEDLGTLRVGLGGRVQAANAAVALGILDALGAAGIATLDEAAVAAGLERVRWPGRMEWLATNGLDVLLDGAHNPEGVEALTATLDELSPTLPAGRPILLLGVMTDKDIERMLDVVASSQLLGRARLVATSVPDSPRGAPPADLAAAWSRVAGPGADGAVVEMPEEALAHASALAREEGGILVVAGSLYLVGHLRSLLVAEPAAA